MIVELSKHRGSNIKRGKKELLKHHWLAPLLSYKARNFGLPLLVR
jgi:hypothetical protein